MLHSFTNKLINETSPYLLQHAHNPVDWFAWSEEALKKAKSENKVILVSIGYSACHWCHVMEKESFENETVALLMNENFVNIKIDREERPDLDHIYMDAVQAITGSGGWPLNVFLTPDAKPFYGGTYYPPVNAFNRSSWTEVLNGIAQSWKERKHEIEAQADNLLAHLSHSNNLIKDKFSPLNEEPSILFSLAHCHEIFANIMKSADKIWGGFGNAPKFPQTFTIQFLLQYQHLTGNKEALQQALLSLDKMLNGGIYDHIDGGLARYSTDTEWLAPHFEKMLYDNALLIDVLCDAWQITGNEQYKAAILKTITFIKKELLSLDGGFYAALDADSEGVEGKFYVWQKNEIDHILKEDSALFCEYFDITENGNWEATNILRILKPVDQFLCVKKIAETEFKLLIKLCIEKLSAKRYERVKPSLDDKIILSWNALMLKAIAKAAIVLQDDSLKVMAQKNFQFIELNFQSPKELAEMKHTYKNGVAKFSAFLDDYAYLIAAAIQLYELDYDLTYLNKAKKYAEHVIENFSDEENNFFYFTHKNQKDIVIRKKEIYDGATPSGNSIMALNLSKLSIVFNEPTFGERALNMLVSIKDSVIRYPSSFGIWASLLQQNFFKVNEISVIGANARKLSKEISLEYIPFKILMASENSNDSYPLLSQKNIAAVSLIYLCKNYTCLKPYKTSAELFTYIDRQMK